MEKVQTKTSLIARTAILVALASVLHAVEALLPVPYVIPGAKLGLANTVALYAIVAMGFWPSVLISFLRTLLGSLLSGTFLNVSYYLSLSGALVSTVAMYVAYRFFGRALSTVGISVIGAIVHNATQLVVASFIIQQAGIFFYLPYLLIFAIPTGVFIGFLVKRIIAGTRRSLRTP